MEEENQPVVIDIGSGYIKAGLAGDDAPRAFFPASVPAPEPGFMGAAGEHAKVKGSFTKYIHPIERGIITDWDGMEKIWHQAFYNELRANPEEQPCLLTEAPMNPKSNREKTAQVMFESFNAPAMQLCNDAVLSLYASGYTTGLVLSSGEGVTRAVPVYEGAVIPDAVKTVDLGGRQLTEHFIGILAEGGFSLTTPAEREIARDVKEKTCYVAEDPEEEAARFAGGEDEDELRKTYELPDGSVITALAGRYRCPEPLFNPGLLGLECDGVHRAVTSAIGACDVDVRSKMYQNIVLSGGSTMFTGMQERLTKEVTALSPADAKVTVLAPEERKYSAWIGGSILSSLSTFSGKWISKEEYDESGPSIVHTKCV